MLDVTARSCTTASGVVVSCVGVSRIAGVPGVVVIVAAVLIWFCQIEIVSVVAAVDIGIGIGIQCIVWLSG